ncbi:MAG: ATP-binding protein [Candidatus Nanopelagicales bacterium]|jgi:anti-sigma regulatory factor (Ser/Thr protein kinase)|nr:ATP-binding protein [Candidatus Nanopelagicales bacterium]
MTVCRLSIPARPDQVRIARLVAVSAARQAGFDEDDVYYVRQAVGEAVGMAVKRHLVAQSDDSIDVVITNAAETWLIDVVDHAGVDTDDEDSHMAMALIEGMTADVAVLDSPGGHHTVRMSWAV